LLARSSSQRDTAMQWITSRSRSARADTDAELIVTRRDLVRGYPVRRQHHVWTISGRGAGLAHHELCQRDPTYLILPTATAASRKRTRAGAAVLAEDVDVPTPARNGARLQTAIEQEALDPNAASIQISIDEALALDRGTQDVGPTTGRCSTGITHSHAPARADQCHCECC
jgi:hypothetical protein